MKKTIIALLLCITVVSVLGCDLNAINAIYSDDAKLAGNADSSASKLYSSKSVGNDFSLSATMTGSKKVWDYNASADTDVTISYLLSVSSGGKAKLVLITPDSEVIIIIENTDNTTATEMQSQTLALKKGNNRIKIVGYESPKISLKLHIETGRFHSS